MTQSLLIAPFKTGLDTDIEPWIAPPDSFRILNNFHVRHNYVEKRNGFREFAQLQTLDPTVSINGVTTANPAEVTTSAPHGYSSGDRVFITGVTPDSSAELNGKYFTITVTSTTQFTIGSPYTDTYSSGGTVQKEVDDTDRVMGIFRFIKSDNSKETIAFNTKRAQRYDTVTNTFDLLDIANIMGSGTEDYIWADNWQASNLVNRLYFTNGLALSGGLNGIRFYDGASTNTTAFTDPAITSLGGSDVLYGCKLFFFIKGRMLCLNTFEYNGSITNQFPQRARWCAFQQPSNWDDTVAGGGGFVDAPTGEHIISARALQDVVIVFFTNSVWTIRPVSDPALPFRWDRINDFRACDSRMGSAQYDRYVAALGIRGITATDGVATNRIDDRIQDFVADDVNVDHFQKVYCLRDYNNKRWWTLYPGGESVESNRALIFDDDSTSYSKYDISMNCLGYGNFARDYALNDFTAANDLDLAIEDFTNETLQSFYWQDNQETMLGGAIDGKVFVMDTLGNDDGAVIECQLETNAWNPFQQENKECRMTFIDLYVDSDQQTQLFIEFYKDTDISPYKRVWSDILPPLDYVTDVVNVSDDNPAQVSAPQHGLSTGDRIYIYGVKGKEDISGGYLITLIDKDTFSLDGIDGSLFGTYTSGGQVLRREFYRTKVWKRILAGGIGFQHRMRLTSEGDSEPLRIHAFKPHFKPIGKRMIN